MTLPSDLVEAWEPWSHYYPIDSLSALTTLPLQLIDEDPEYLIPSIRLGKDRPYLASVLVITESYLCEVRLRKAHGRQGDDDDFDFAPRKSIFNYRVKLGKHVIEGDDDDDIVHQTARIQVLHSAAFEFATTLSYVGDNLATWLSLVQRALPVSLVKGSAASR